MSRPPSRAFQQTLWEVQKRWGEQALTTAAALTRAPGIPTGLQAVDTLLTAGGLARGQMTVLTGRPTCGMTSLILTALANIQKLGLPAVYLDLSQTFDPHYAWRCGIDLDTLLLVQPKTAMQTLAMARDVVKTVPAVVILDAGTQAAFAPSLLKDFHDPLTKSQSAAVVLASAGWANPLSHTRLRVEREAWHYRHGDVAGYRVRLTVEQTQQGISGKQASLDLFLDPAVDGDAS